MKRTPDSNRAEQKTQESPTEDEDFESQEDSIDYTAMDMTFEISDIFSLCKERCNPRFLSTMTFMILRHFNISFREADTFLSLIGAMTAKTCEKWVQTFLRDFDDFLDEGRGGKQKDSFYDLYPDLEIEAQGFVVAACSQKSSSFTIIDLAKFIDQRFYEIHGSSKTGDGLVRSVEACRLDLRRWGASYKANSSRPYFEGHERIDVVAHRNDFIKYFLDRQSEYYTITHDERPKWVIPSAPRPTILICRWKHQRFFAKRRLLS